MWIYHVTVMMVIVDLVAWKMAKTSTIPHLGLVKRIRIDMWQQKMFPLLRRLSLSTVSHGLALFTRKQIVNCFSINHLSNPVSRKSVPDGSCSESSPSSSDYATTRKEKLDKRQRKRERGMSVSD